MLRSIIIILALSSIGSAASWFNFGYPRAGQYYIAGKEKENKSVRAGSPGYTRPGYGSRSFKRGK